MKHVMRFMLGVALLVSGDAWAAKEIDTTSAISISGSNGSIEVFEILTARLRCSDLSKRAADAKTYDVQGKPNTPDLTADQAACKDEVSKYIAQLQADGNSEAAHVKSTWDALNACKSTAASCIATQEKNFTAALKVAASASSDHPLNTPETLAIRKQMHAAFGGDLDKRYAYEAALAAKAQHDANFPNPSKQLDKAYNDAKAAYQGEVDAARAEILTQLNAAKAAKYPGAQAMIDLYNQQVAAENLYETEKANRLTALAQLQADGLTAQYRVERARFDAWVVQSERDLYNGKTPASPTATDPVIPGMKNLYDSLRIMEVKAANGERDVPASPSPGPSGTGDMATGTQTGGSVSATPPPASKQMIGIKPDAYTIPSNNYIQDAPPGSDVISGSSI